MQITDSEINDYVEEFLACKDFDYIGIAEDVLENAGCDGKTYCAIVFHTLFDLGLISCEKYDELVKKLIEVPSNMNETDTKTKMILDIIDVRASLNEALSWCKRHVCESCPIYECCEGTPGKNIFDRIPTMLDDTEKIVKGVVKNDESA